MSSRVDSKVSKRYASALFNAATQLKQVEVVSTNLSLISSLWQSAPVLKRTMESPVVPSEKKSELINTMFGAELDNVTMAFMHLLVSKRREEIVPQVHQEFSRLSDDANGLVRAEVTVAETLTPAQTTALQTGLEVRTGKKVALSVNLEPAILGGVVVRMNDTVIDGSVRGSLERLRERLMQER